MNVGDRYAPIVLKVLGVLAVVILLASVAAGNDHPAVDLAGFYRCEGAGADGGAYRGIVEISRHADVYVVRWVFESGDWYTGIGVVNGNALAVTYVGRAQGVAAYTIEEPGRVVGTWTVVGANGRVFAETLTKFSEELRAPLDDEPPHPTSAPFRRLPGLPVAGFVAPHAA